MSNYQVEATAVIDAPADRVYGIIADYHAGHPAILPSRYFTRLDVKAGGRGAGTVAAVEMNVFGTQVLYEMTVTEPEPGARVAREEDPRAGVVTTFTVDPVNDGAQSRVTIATTARTNPGVRGWLEKLTNPAITRRIYREELAQLAAVARAAA